MSSEHASYNCLPQIQTELMFHRGVIWDIVMQDHVSEAQRAPPAPSPSPLV